MIDFIINQIVKIKTRLEVKRQRRRWEALRNKGMKIGKRVNLPMSTWIDTSHCFLISIGDNCGFGEECLILAHDAMPDEFIDSTRIGLVTIHESCHFGARAVILPGVEIGPRSIVGSNAVVTKDIPPDSVAVGNPAKVICTLEEFLTKQRKAMETLPLFPFKEYDINHITPEKKLEMLAKLSKSDGYMVGGYTAMLEDGEGVVRTD